MKPFAFVITTAVLISLAVISYRHTTIHTVHAQNGCDATSVSGPYGYAFSGFLTDNQGYYHFFSASGRIVADANGGLNGHDTISVDGSVTRGRSYAGSYQVNSDCTGSITLGNTTGSATADFVVTNGGNEIQFIQSNPGSNVTGFAKRQ
jgi:hypothetical protein